MKRKVLELLLYLT